MDVSVKAYFMFLLSIGLNMFAYAQAPDWVVSSNSTAIESANTLAVDSINEWIYVGGSLEAAPGSNLILFSELLSIENTNLPLNNEITLNGELDSYIAKFNYEGELIWVTSFGSDKFDKINGICVGPDFNVYCTGSFEKSFVILGTDGITNIELNKINGGETDKDIFTISLNSDGEVLWGQTSGGEDDDLAFDIEACEDGIAVIGVYKNSNAVLCGEAPTQDTNYTSLFLFKYSFAGETQWLMTAGSNDDVYDVNQTFIGSKYSLSSYGNQLYAFGDYIGSSLEFSNTSNDDLDLHALINADEKDDLFLISLSSSNGEINWTNAILGNDGSIEGFGLASDCEGIYLSAAANLSSGNELIFPSGEIVSAGLGNDFFLSKFDHESGSDLWVDLYSGIGSVRNIPYKLSVNGSGNLSMAGKVNDQFSFDSFSSVFFTGDSQAFYAEFQNDGTLLNSSVFGGVNDDVAFDIAYDPNGNLFVCGMSSDDFSLMDTMIDQSYNSFVAKITSNVILNEFCCTNPPQAGIAEISNSIPCRFEEVNVSLTGYDGEIQWEQSTDGGAVWNDIEGANLDNHSFIPNTTSLIRAKVSNLDCTPVHSNVLTLIAPGNDFINCPFNFSVDVGDNCEFEIPSYLNQLGLSDCSLSYLSQSPAEGEILSPGTYPVSIHVTSTSEVICSFILLVADNTYPTIQCPEDVVINADANCEYEVPDFTLNSQASDNCGVTISQSPIQGSILFVGSHEVIITAEDSNGHTSNCSVNIEILDITSAILDCIGNQELSRNDNCEAILLDYRDMVTCADACGGECLMTQSPIPGTVLFSDQVVTISSDDGYGNITECTFVVILLDDTAPNVVCYNGNQIITQNEECDFVVPDYGQLITSSDNCETDLIISQTPSTGELISGSTLISLSYSDGQNITACEFTAIPLALIEVPTITCPSNQTVNFDEDCSFVLADYTTIAVTSESCNGTIGVQQNPPPGGVYFEEIDVILTSTLQLLESEPCSFTVSPIDLSAPSIDCLENQYLALNDDCEYIVPNFSSLISVNDNCDESLSIVQVPEAGTVIENDVEMFIYSVDDSGNSAECSFLLHLENSGLSELNCEDIVVLSGPNCTYLVPDFAVQFLPETNCGVADWTQSIDIGSVLDPGSYNLDFWVLDNQDNELSCSTTLTINGNTAPQFVVCPDELDIETSANSCLGVVPDMMDHVQIVDCAGDGANYVITQFPAVFEVIDETTSVNILAQDLDGQTAECIVQLNVLDLSPPQIDCSNFSAIEYLDLNCTYTVGEYAELIGATDNCGIQEFTQDPIAGETLDRSVNEIVFTAVDLSGNISTCQTELIIVDTISPVITDCMSSGISLPGGESCSREINNYSFGVAALTTDNCDQFVTVTQYPASGTELMVGEHDLIFTATDSDGNSSTCITTFHVLDITNPEIELPDEEFVINLEGDCEYPLEDYTGFFAVTDPCTDLDNIEITQIPEPGSVVYTDLNINITATDPYGNSSMVSYPVFVNESSIFDLVTDLDTITEYVNSYCHVDLGSYVEFIELISLCGQQNAVIQDPQEINPGEAFPEELNFTMDMVDGIEIQVPYQALDIENPVVFAYPDEIELFIDDNCELLLEDYTSLGGASDNCTNPPLMNQIPAPGYSLNIGPNDVIIQAMDQSGNTAEHTIVVYVHDTSIPIIVDCVEDQIINTNDNCEFEVVDYSEFLIVDDNCGDIDGIIITQYPEPGEFLFGNQEITMTVTDASGNSTACSFNINVQDNLSPNIECPENSIEVSANFNCQYMLDDLTQGLLVTDNCSDNFDLWTVPEQGSTLGLGPNDVIIYASDESSNESSCVVSVNVVDTSPPFADVETIELVLELNDNCEAVMPDLSDEFEFFDNCDSDLTFMQSHEPNELLELETLFGAISVIDDAENTFILSYTIIVQDSESPILEACPEVIDISAEEACSFIMPDYTSLIGYSDCTEVTIEQFPEPDSQQTASQDVTLIFTDAYNNSSECSFWLNVEDDVSPEITCPEDQTISLLEDCELILGSYIDWADATDNCQIASIEQSPSTDYLIEPGETIELSFSAYDYSNNLAQCSFELTFVDQIAPEIDCGEDIDVSVDPDICGAVVEFDPPEYSDNCPNISLVQLSGLNSGSEFPVGPTLMEFQLTDLSGNISTCSYTINVIDDVLPLIICPNSISSCDPLVFFDTPEALDVCGISSVYQSDESGLTSGMEFPVGTTTIEYTVIDNNENISVCNFEVEIFENINADWSIIPELICQNSGEIDFNTYVNTEFDFFWTGDIATGILDANTLELGNYSVTLNVANGDCSADSSQMISIVPVPSISLNPNVEVCELLVELEANVSEGQIVWSAPPGSSFLSDNTSESVLIECSEYGSFEYSITVTSDNSCTSESSVVVSYYQTPDTPYAGEDQELHFQMETFLNGDYGGVGEYNWSIIQGNSDLVNDDILNPEVNNLSIGINEFMLEVSNGVCPKEFDSVIVNVHGLMIPSGFSPNGDMVNDSFEIKGLENWSNTPLSVFNRWGALVYKNENYKNEWNGEGINGGILPDDTYFYVISIGITEYKGYLVIKK